MVPYLSNELIDQIFCFLDNEQLKVVRFASVAFSQIAAPFLFERLVVDFNQVFREVKRDNRPLLEFIQAIGNGETSLGRHIRRLSVVTPLDAHTQEEPAKTLGTRMAKWMSRKETFQDVVIKALVAAAPRLVALRTVSWQGFSDYRFLSNCTPALGPVVASILAHPYLHTVSFIGHTPTLPKSLQHSTRLSSLSYDGFHANTTLPPIIAQSPQLKSLVVVNRGHRTSLRDLFAGKSPYPHLRFLSLDNVAWTADVISRLPSLSDLATTRADMSPSVWEALDRTHTVLLSISIRDVKITDSFLDYLASTEYRRPQGGRALSFQACKQLAVVDDPSRAKRFWENVVPNIRTTLVLLNIDCDYPSEWCLTERTLKVLMQCHFLYEIRMNVIWGDIREESVIKRMLDQLSFDVWPDLRVLSLAAVALPAATDAVRSRRPMASGAHSFLKETKQMNLALQNIVESMKFDVSKDLSTTLLSVAIYAGGKGPYVLRKCRGRSKEFEFVKW